MPTAEEIAALQQALTDALRRNDSLAGELRVVRTERDLLKEQLNKFKRQLFAAKSEVSGLHQKDLFFNEAESLGAKAQPATEEDASDDDTVDVPSHQRRKRGRKPLDPALPREVVRHELPGRWVRGTLTLYRQAALLGRFGGTDISRNTLAAGVVRVGQAVQPVVNLLRDALLESPIVYGDETEIQVLKEPGRSAQARSYMWAQMTEASGAGGTGPPLRLFAYSPSRSTKTAQDLYAGIRGGGVLMTDGYEPYNSIAEANGLVHLGCWAHCRRHLNDALQVLPKDKRGPEQLPARFIGLIGGLYRVEAQARRAALDAHALHRQRQEHSVPLLKKIEDLLIANLHGVLPQCLLGKALHYMAAQWPKLARFVDDGRYPIDNNACENSIRPFCVGRRNWLFADTVGGANASANLYSLLQTCMANGIDGYRYFKALLVALPKAKTVEDYEALLPWRIAMDAR